MTRQRPEPVYKTIKKYILDKIQREEWPAGTRIPSEAEFVERFNTSRMTVNRAMRELTVSGRIIRKQGLGTFVARRKPQSSFLEISSIADEIRKSGGKYSCEVHLLCEEKGSPALSREMEVQPYSPVFHCILVHKNEGIPIQLADRYVCPETAPEFLRQDFSTLAPAEYLLEIAPEFTAEHIVEALIPDAWIRDLLEINESEPCLVLRRKTWVKGRVATFSSFFYPGSRYSLGGRFTAGQQI
ncbi:MAG: histidine utilization repressor [Desulfopila sp.]|nr:histidine utilization repressor [Desulfopila sp.]